MLSGWANTAGNFTDFYEFGVSDFSLLRKQECLGQKGDFYAKLMMVCFNVPFPSQIFLSVKESSDENGQ